MLNKIKNKNKTKAIINKEKNDKKHKEVTNSNRKTGMSEFSGAYRLFEKYAEKDNNKTICVISDFETAYFLARNNKICYITHDIDNYEKFRKLVIGSIKFGNDDECFFVNNKSDYPNEIDAYQKTFFNEINNNMKQFDKIIMNPPYDKNLHLKILEKVIEINPDAEIVCLHPARWLIDPLRKYKSNSDYAKFKNTIVDKMTDYINFGYSANELLGMGLDGHLCISMYNTKKKDIKIYNRDIESLIDRIVAKSPNNIANNIELDKIDGWRCITKVMLPLQGGNTDRSKLAFVNLFQCVEHNIFYNGYEGDKYWTEVRKASGGVNKARYESGQPLSHSIKFKTEQEALNYEASMKTNFIHNWIHLIKLDQNVPLKFIPYMDNYSHIWTDEMYCKYFGLNEEESKYMSRKVDDYRIKDFIKYETI